MSAVSPAGRSKVVRFAEMVIPGVSQTQYRLEASGFEYRSEQEHEQKHQAVADKVNQAAWNAQIAIAKARSLRMGIRNASFKEIKTDEDDKEDFEVDPKNSLGNNGHDKHSALMPWHLINVPHVDHFCNALFSDWLSRMIKQDQEHVSAS